MARTQRIKPDDILDAAARVITRLGSAGLSIDAVAQEAGISKSQVVYYHKSKSGILEAIIDRQFKRDQDLIEHCVAKSADTPHPELFGRIASAQQLLTETDKAVAVAISASLSNDDSLQKIMQDWTKNDLSAMAAGPKPEAALMAYLALTGFYCTELFGFHEWTSEERGRILEGLRTVYRSYEER